MRQSASPLPLTSDELILPSYASLAAPHRNAPNQGINTRLLVDSQSSDDNHGRDEQLTDGKMVKIKNPHLYQPKWLTKRLLAGVLLLLGILCVTLGVLWRIVSSQDGLPLNITSSHYAWTYGPTAILLLLLSIWRQVDYHSKLTQPWREMFSTYSSPQRSILLDYVSPMHLISLYKSFRQRQYPVVVSVSGFIMIKLAILVSTTLFLQEQTLRSEAIPVQYVTSFNSSNLWSQLPSREGVWNQQLRYYQWSDNNTVTNLPWGYLSQLNGQALDPTHVKDNKVFQSFTLSAWNNNSIQSITAPVDVFIPNVTCETAATNLSIIPMDLPSLISRIVIIKATSYVSLTVNINCSMGHSQNRQYFTSDNTTSAYVVDLVICSETPEYSKFVVAAIDPDSGSLGRAAVVLCNVGFNVRKINLTQLPSGIPIDLKDSGSATGSPIDLNSTELSRILYTSLYKNYDMQIEETDLPTFSIPDAWPAMFLLMYKGLGLSANWDDFLDPNKMKQAASSVFQGLSLQLAMSELLSPTNINGAGRAVVSDQKLYIRPAPLIFMIVCFVAVACLAIASMLLLKEKVIPQSPGLIASYATILARSPSLATILNGTGESRTSLLRKALDGLQVKASVSNQEYSIHVNRLTEEANRPAGKSKTKRSDWIPFAIRTPMLLMSLLFPIIVIAGLEVIQRISNSSNGVVELSNSDSSIVYATHYGSTLVVLLVATLFNNLDFVITTFTPFSALQSANKSSKRNLFVNLVGEVPIVALYQCLRYNYFGTTFSMIAALLGSILTIIVSGLWEVDNQVMVPRSIIAEMEPWNFLWANNSANDNGAARLLNVIDFGGDVEPTSIRGAFVVPKIEKWYFASTSVSGQAENSTSQFEFTINSLSPELVCTVATQESIYYNSVNISGSAGQGLIVLDTVEAFHASFQLPPACWLGPSRNSGNVTLDYLLPSSALDPASIIGKVYDLDTDPIPNNSTSFDVLSNRLDSTGCPSLGFVFGHFEDATALLCSQKIRRMPMQVYYSGDPSLNAINHQRLLSIENSTSREYAIDTATGLQTYQYRIQKHLEENLVAYNYTPTISNFFDHLLNGPYGIEQDSVLGRDNANNLIVAINKIYNKYMTLVIDMNFRSPSPPSNTRKANETSRKGNDGETATKTVANGTIMQQVTRLKMNNSSKLTLQIVLGVMTTFMAIAVKTVKIRRVLPRNPHSIASVMGFLAGSKLCDPRENIIPPGSEFLKKEELSQIFESRRFRLGWWTLRDINQDVKEIADESHTIHERHILVKPSPGSSTSGDRRFGIDVT
ncbi:hypothetical protein F4680DRAFT_466377 [Xylaria scruposa]|nr:hypothetical protein F4680DRAFT_466377 [Xylaria scruposa]